MIFYVTTLFFMFLISGTANSSVAVENEAPFDFGTLDFIVPGGYMADRSDPQSAHLPGIYIREWYGKYILNTCPDLKLEHRPSQLDLVQCKSEPRELTLVIDKAGNRSFKLRKNKKSDQTDYSIEVVSTVHGLAIKENIPLKRPTDGSAVATSFRYHKQLYRQTDFLTDLNFGYTDLFYKEMVQKLLSKASDPATKQYLQLQLAALSGDFEALKKAVDGGADLNAYGPFGENVWDHFFRNIRKHDFLLIEPAIEYFHARAKWTYIDDAQHALIRTLVAQSNDSWRENQAAGLRMFHRLRELWTIDVPADRLLRFKLGRFAVALGDLEMLEDALSGNDLSSEDLQLMFMDSHLLTYFGRLDASRRATQLQIFKRLIPLVPTKILMEPLRLIDDEELAEIEESLPKTTEFYDAMLKENLLGRGWQFAKYEPLASDRAKGDLLVTLIQDRESRKKSMTGMDEFNQKFDAEYIRKCLDRIKLYSKVASVEQRTAAYSQAIKANDVDAAMILKADGITENM